MVRASGSVIVLLLAASQDATASPALSSEDAVSLVQHAAASASMKPREDGKQLDFLSGKFLTPEELEDVTQARMTNWIRPAFWVDRAKELFKPKGKKASPSEDEARQQDEADMKRIQEALSQLAKLQGVPQVNGTSATSDDEAKRQDAADIKQLQEALGQLADLKEAPAEQAPVKSAVSAHEAKRQDEAEDKSVQERLTKPKQQPEEHGTAVLDTASDAARQQDEQDFRSMEEALGQLAKLEKKPAEEPETGKQVRDLISGKMMTPEELEDVTQARMRNWVRPGFWVDRLKGLIGKHKGKSSEQQ